MAIFEQNIDIWYRKHRYPKYRRSRIKTQLCPNLVEKLLTSLSNKLRGKMWEFNIKKRVVSLLSSHLIKLGSWNLVCIFSSRDLKCAVLRFQLFSRIALPRSCKNVIFLVSFFSFWRLKSFTRLEEWGRLWIKIQLCTNLAEEVLRGQKHKNCFFLSQLLENPKLYNIFKNQPSWSTEIWGVFRLLDFEKRLFFPHLPTKLN